MIQTDSDGYLKNLNDWNKSVAKTIAMQENITLTDEHWLLIDTVRDFYQKYDHTPAIRPLVKLMREKLGQNKGSGLYLQSLFPGGAAKQLAKIAGLPKPTRCT